MAKRDDILGVIEGLERMSGAATYAEHFAEKIDRPDLQKRFQEVREYASQQSQLLYAVLGTPQQEKTDERTPADS